MIKKKALLLFLLSFSALVLTSCKDIQLFEEEVDPNEQIYLEDYEITPDTYYIKNGTRFVAVYMPYGNIKEKAKMVKKSRTLWMVETNGDEALVPVHYSDELVAYASEKADLKEVSLERFKDLGHSIGVCGGELKNDGYYHVTIRKNTTSGSSFQLLIDETPSTEIRIESINGIKVSKEMIEPNTGVFIGLEKGSTYKVGFFSGTYYYEADVTADTHFLQAYELYTYGTEQLKDTRHGYMCFETPSDLKSGWYNINGSGLFKYYNFKKGEQLLESVDMNEQYYNSEEEMIAACSTEYSFTLSNTIQNLKVEVEIEENLNETDCTIMAYSPNGMLYEMKKDERTERMLLSITEAMPGTWKIHVMPKSIEVVDINVRSESNSAALTLAETKIEITEDKSNIMFCAEYEGEGTVNGVLICPNGESYVMEKLSTIKEENGISTYKMGYKMPYVAAGTYTVRMYHYPLETKLGIPYTEETGDVDTDIIIIQQ